MNKFSLAIDVPTNEGKVLKIFQVDCNTSNGCRVDDYRPS